MKGNKGHTDPDASLTVESTPGLSRIQVAVQGLLKTTLRYTNFEMTAPSHRSYRRGPRDLTKRC